MDASQSGLALLRPRPQPVMIPVPGSRRVPAAGINDRASERDVLLPGVTRPWQGSNLRRTV